LAAETEIKAGIKTKVRNSAGIEEYRKKGRKQGMNHVQRRRSRPVRGGEK
jgi:hypothetical protein